MYFLFILAFNSYRSEFIPVKYIILNEKEMKNFNFINGHLLKAFTTFLKKLALKI